MVLQPKYYVTDCFETGSAIVFLLAAVFEKSLADFEFIPVDSIGNLFFFVQFFFRVNIVCN